MWRGREVGVEGQVMVRPGSRCGGPVVRQGSGCGGPVNGKAGK